MADRRRWLIWAAGAYVGILVVVTGGLWLLYRGARDHLDEALGLRLLAVANTAVQLVDGDRLGDWAFAGEESTDLLWLTSRCEQIRRENDLAELTLCDADGFVIISTTARLDRGETNVYWDLDRPAVELAREGFPAVSHLYRAGPLYQKSAHAPVFDRRGEVVGVLTVEGNADFFGALAALRRGAVLTIASVFVFLALLGLLLLRSQRALEQTRAQLLRQENLAAMGRMTAGIAHEIRNPLGIIRGAGEHLQRILRDRGLEDEVAAFIPAEVDRLDRILAGYLALGTDREGEPEDLDLGALVRRTARLVADELARAQVSLAITDPLPLAPVRGDPRRLQQVLLNLLLNARDAMPAGGRIDVALRGDGDRLQLTVLDTGGGLRDIDPEQAFEAFRTTKDKGSGLGLAVSRRIARAHGGDLSLADRTDGHGCQATLTLPRRPD